MIHHDVDGTWSVRERETGRHAIFRGSPVAGLSEKSAAFRAKRLDEASELKVGQDAARWPNRPALRRRDSRPGQLQRGSGS